jgi:hypothetical protein
MFYFQSLVPDWFDTLFAQVSDPFSFERSLAGLKQKWAKLSESIR